VEDEAPFGPLIWKRGALLLLDQTLLPGEVKWRSCATAEDVAQAIAERRVRGATAVAIAAAYGVALAARQRVGEAGSARLMQNAVEEAVEKMRRATPASSHVFMALAQVRDAARVSVETADAFMVADAVEARARAVHAEDVARCQRLGSAGAELIADGATVLTLGNYGALATGGWGTSLGVLRSAWRSCRRARVIVCESRPLLDGARLTAWELERDGFDVTVIPDGAAHGLLQRREVSMVLLGADRVSGDGDVVGELGGYGVALAAAAAAVPVVVAAIAACIDPAMSLDVGAVSPAVLRAAATPPFGVPERVALRCPGGDVIPGALIGAIVTERGVHRPPWPTSLRS